MNAPVVSPPYVHPNEGLRSRKCLRLQKGEVSGDGVEQTEIGNKVLSTSYSYVYSLKNRIKENQEGKSRAERERERARERKREGEKLNN